MLKNDVDGTVETPWSGHFLTGRVQTTGLCGGDSGHGGETLIEIEDNGGGFCGELTLEVHGQEPITIALNSEGSVKLSILGRGDYELLALRETFEGIAKKLQEAAKLTRTCEGPPVAESCALPVMGAIPDDDGTPPDFSNIV